MSSELSMAVKVDGKVIHTHTFNGRYVAGEVLENYFKEYAAFDKVEIVLTQKYRGKVE